MRCPLAPEKYQAGLGSTIGSFLIQLADHFEIGTPQATGSLCRQGE